MIARIAWWAGIAVIGMATCFAQLDRAARFDPAFSALVPDAFAGFAAEQRTRISLDAQEGEAALVEARLLVAGRPAPGEHLAYLSLAAAQAGDEQLALRALEESARRGWRVPVAQLAAARAALASADYDRAAQRLAALIATGRLPEPTRIVVAELLSTSAGREAMARQLAAKGYWQGRALPGAFSESEPDFVKQTLASAISQGAQLPCDRLLLTFAMLEQRGIRASDIGYAPVDADAC